MDTVTTEPKGIGGWLVLPALGLLISPIRFCFLFYSSILPSLMPATWNALTNSNSPAYHPLWGPLIVFESISNLALFIFTLRLLWLFFKKSNRVPGLVVIWLVLSMALQVVDILFAAQIPAVAVQQNNLESVKDLTRSLVAAVIWIPYFKRSKRVKNTFVEFVS